jgi:Copper transport outer membrane protein, MctB
VFDLRYHVASLAGVFFALIIGILVGVALAERGGVDLRTQELLEQRIDVLQRRLDAAQRQAENAGRQQEAIRSFVEESYPAVMHDRLRGKRIALVFVGSVSGPLRSAVEQALEDAGAPPPIRMRALKVPVDPQALDGLLAARPGSALPIGKEARVDLGRALAEELVAGGRTPMWDLVSDLLVEEREGGSRRPVDGVVIARTARPQRGQTARLLAGFYSGLAAAGPPTVGVELLETSDSAVKSYKEAGLSSVDNVDTPAGRLALVVLLANPRLQGNYGVKRTAEDGGLPRVEPLPVAETAGG